MNGVTTFLVDFGLLSFLALVALAIARLRDLFAAVMMAGIFGLLSAGFFVAMDAVDVAFTEAAVGAGVSTLLMLHTLSLTGRHAAAGAAGKSRLALALVALAGGALMYGTSDMPAFGSADAPVHRHVAPRYLEDSAREIGIPNVVTSVLASYRGYDTFGELIVIFTAGIGVLALLALGRDAREDGALAEPMHEHAILRAIAKMLIPLIMLFALYVQFHGDYGPGGGFQAGVIFASAVILYAVLFSPRLAEQAVPPSLVRALAAGGALLYGGVGVACMLSGGPFLDYGALRPDAVAGQHLGILLVELGVGVTVASVMIMIFLAFINYAAQGRAGR